jgi:DNA sulfur modification protein DndB
LRAAIDEDPKVSEYQIPVAVYNTLSTSNSARIFISINTEQRPAPKSLAFDLYGVTATDLMDPAAIRAGDIVSFLGSVGEPFEGWIRLPNQGKQRGGVALSTAVTSIKPLVESKGVLDQLGLSDLEVQQANYFNALRSKYRSHWDDKSNAFIYASGFIGAIEFLRSNIIDYCRSKGSFEENTISVVLNLDESNLIYVKKM